MLIHDAIALFIEGYFSTCKRSDKTKAAYTTDLAQFRLRFNEDRDLDSIRADELEEWARALTDEGYAAVSVRRKFASLKVFFGYWVRKGVVASSPLWRIRLDLAREQKLPRNIPLADATRLLQAAWVRMSSERCNTKVQRDAPFLASRNLAALEILFATGMRVGELVSLRLSDWNEDEQSIHVKGKGGRHRLAFLTDQRSLAALAEYLPRRRKVLCGHESLFVNLAGGPLSTQGVARVLTGLAAEAGITMRLTPHMVRHTVATLLLRNGADIRVVQEVLGHSSIAMTQRYTHVSKEHLRETLQMRHPSHHMAIDRQAGAHSL
ncbi:tyrosine-type recombinase/integrase [uncultured Paludibaculum sp.]|uniref:tyrosine-type recombinase/integrase n=1 Tax=uncultured Paludibaculum sp. TaxID=1765020 RepID=UPI002AAB0CBD|nr:tyrosine-type recombinase/integrase [uncultured Paludibaculum sp.]